MDNAALNDLMLSIRERQSWVVLWGDPEREQTEEAQFFTDPVMEHWFPIRPEAMKPGDILFVHRIKVSTLIFVGEVISSLRAATDTEIRNDPRQSRWAWSIDAKNLTPEFGASWRDYPLKTFTLKDEYNDLNPQDRVNLGRLNFGRPVRISSGFAEFLLNQIIRL